MREPAAARRTGVLLAGFGVAVAGILAGFLGYVGIGYACGGTDASEPSASVLCDGHPAATFALWGAAVAAPLLGGFTGRVAGLLAGAAVGAAASLLLLVAFWNL